MKTEGSGFRFCFRGLCFRVWASVGGAPGLYRVSVRVSQGAIRKGQLLIGGGFKNYTSGWPWGFIACGVGVRFNLGFRGYSLQHQEGWFGLCVG